MKKVRGKKKSKTMKTIPIPVRLDDNTRARLRNISGRMGLAQSAVVRLAIAKQLPQIESGTIILPPQDKKAVGE